MGPWVNFLKMVAFEQLPGRYEQEMYTIAKRKNLAMTATRGLALSVCCVVEDQQEGRWIGRGSAGGI